MDRKEIKRLRYYRRWNRASRKRHGVIYMENSSWGWVLPKGSKYAVIVEEELQKIV